MAFEKTLFFLLLMLFPKAMESKTPENPRELGVSNAYGSRKGPKEEMREKINTIKALLDEVSALAEICGACDSNPCLNGGTCVEEEKGRYTCTCAVGWKGDRCEVCNKALGMETGKIPDDQITASSSESEHPASRGRLNFEVSPGNPKSWSARHKNSGQWLQVDLGIKPRNVSGIATQGGNTYRGRLARVTRYNLQYSNDGVEFHLYKEQGQSTAKVFAGNNDFNSIKYHDLTPPIEARYIRFNPTNWKNWIAMRVELYGCQEIKPCDSGPCLNGGNCTNEAGGNFSCQCTIGWTGDRCQDVSSVGEIQDSTIVGNNEAHLTKLSEWLEPVMQSDHQWVLCWRASRDGWSASTFHSNCDNKGPTVTIIKVDQYIFGGYTSMSWNVNGVYQSDKTAFLFSLVNKPGWDPLKLPQPGQGDTSYAYSTYSGSGYGPTFGAGHDLYIADQASSNANSYTYLGYSYSPPPGHSYTTEFTYTFLSGGSGTYAFTPSEVETYYESK